MPLFEEMGYMPTQRYATGEEIRKYANLAAEKFNIAPYAVFQTKAEKLVWDEASKEWQVELVQKRNGEEPQRLNIRSSFVATIGGVLDVPKLPGVAGIAEFQGRLFTPRGGIILSLADHLRIQR
jgi:cation diffusion facilitator CzcD-associated flavoprotein CzcO